MARHAIKKGKDKSVAIILWSCTDYKERANQLVLVKHMTDPQFKFNTVQNCSDGWIILIIKKRENKISQSESRTGTIVRHIPSKHTCDRMTDDLNINALPENLIIGIYVA